MTAPAAAPVRTLLDQVVADALEPDYAVRSSTRPSAAATQRRRFGVGVFVSLLIVGFAVVLVVGDVRSSAPDVAAERRELVQRVQERTIATDALAADVTDLRTEVAQARDASLALTRSGRERARALALLEVASGATAVAGPGLRVTVDDAESSPSDDATSVPPGRVQDRDLQLVVNGLWVAGAEAVSVGGYRITSRAAIRSAGDAILVDFRPVAPPYVVEAIGDPSTLGGRFADGPGGRTLQTLSSTFGIRYSAERVDDLALAPAASLGDGTTRGEAP